MQASKTMDTCVGSMATPAAPRRLVTDAPTRMFHWLFAVTFVGAYLTAESEHWRLLHVTLGYSFAGLLCFRVVYGLFGPRQIRLSLLWRKLGAGPAWIRSLLDTRSLAQVNWRQGQNLAMAAVIALMLSMVVPLVLSGHATYNEWGGSLGGDMFEEVHEFFGNTFLTVALTHLCLLVLLSVLRRQNQALPMVSGHVPGAGPSAVKHNRRWLAALLLLAVLSFGAWYWQTSQSGPIPGIGDKSSAIAKMPAAVHHARKHDDR